MKMCILLALSISLTSCAIVNRAAITIVEADSQRDTRVRMADTHSVDGDKAADANAAVSTSSGSSTATDGDKPGIRMSEQMAVNDGKEQNK